MLENDSIGLLMGTIMQRKCFIGETAACFAHEMVALKQAKTTLPEHT